MLRSLPVVSYGLGLSGQCDVVEFRASPQGVSLRGEEGLWLPYPVEYKRGRPKAHQADELQLCAQAMCLEEMLCCPIPEGALYYGEPRRRTAVSFSQELRQEVRSITEEMHQFYRRGYTPKAKPSKSCNACSLKDLCLPQLVKKRPVSDYLSQARPENVNVNTLAVSLPSRGAWIEISSVSMKVCQMGASLPSRGAWIEIPYSFQTLSHPSQSLPSRGAWIEML